MAGELHPNRWKRFWKWIDLRLGLEGFAYPTPAHADRLLYTLGGITLAGVIVLIVSGFYLAQLYNPNPDAARESVEYIMNEAPLGLFARNLHFWMATLVTISMLLHGLRVYASGAYRRPRELNWLVGVILGVVTIGLVFTGSILKWDQEAGEALAHSQEVGEILGPVGLFLTPDFAPGTPLLERTFAWHVAILPVLLIAFLATHFLLIRRHGISSLPGHQEPRPGDEKDSDLAIAAEGASTFSRHLLHVLGWGIALLVVGSVLALVYSAPLGPTFDPDMEVTKPPWIFMPLYPFESWFGLDALLWLPIAVSVVLVLVPAFDRYKSSSLRRRWVMLAAMGVLVLAVIVIGIYGQLSEPAEHIEMGE